MGASAFLTKPFLPAELCDMVRALETGAETD
jgi:DNA-binding response OmpR family regulator